MARFLGFDNIAEGDVSGAVAETAWGRLPVPAGVADGPCRVLVRPSGVRLVPAEGAALRCEVVSRTFRGGRVGVVLRPERGPGLEAECGLADTPDRGARVGVAFAADDVTVLDA